ncbi:MAG: Ig-like domain-containing protein, partial [Clostridia bacterium]|nr:Ig-like domain-containing protein [Clostridia bacterium]
MDLDINASYQLNPISAPIPYANDEFVYESSNTKVAIVSDTGLIRPTGEGTADIYVYSKDKAVRNYVTVNVTDHIPLQDFSFTAVDATVAVGETVSTQVAFTPMNTTRKSVTYSSSDNKIVSVDVYGNFYGISSGEATVTASCEGIDKTIKVKVFKKTAIFELETPAMLAEIDEGVVQLPRVITSEGSETNIVWRVLDEEIARIVDGKIVLKTIGATTLEAIDLNSGLRVNCSLIVQEEVYAVRDIQVSNFNSERYYYLWLDNGDLYYWGSYGTIQPTLCLQNVVKFSAFRGSFLALTKDGTLAKYSITSNGKIQQGGKITKFNIEDIVDIAYCNGNFFVLLKNGTAFAWGTNSEGQLGIGNFVSPTEPMLVNLDAKIVDIFAREVYTYFLTDNGDVYGVGRGNENPKFVVSGIEKMFKVQDRGIYDSGCMLLSKDKELLSIYDYGTSGRAEGISFEGYDVQYYYDYQVMAIKNGEIYKFKFDSYRKEPYTIERILGIYNATKIFGFRYTN